MSDKLLELDEYAEIACDLVDNPDNVEMRKVWAAIDKMHNCEVALPKNITDLDWVGKDARFADPIVRDSIEAVVRFLSNRNPDITVRPMRPDPQEHERMEFVETIADWHWRGLNKRDAEPFRSKLVRSVAMYAACAFQTIYLPWEAKRPEKLYTEKQIKLLRRNGDFIWQIHNPQNVYPTYANGFLKSVMSTSVRTLKSVADEYGYDHEAVKKAKADLSGDNEQVDMRNEYVSFFDFTDCYNRIIWFTCNGSNATLNTDGEEKYELLRAPHKLPFLNWVVMDYGEPLAKGVYKAGLYDHKALYNTVFHAKVLQQVADKDTIINAVNPNSPNLVDDENNPTGERIIGMQDRITRLPSHQLDPQLVAAMGMLDKQLAASMSVTALVAIEQYIGGNTPFSSINAAQSTASAHLGPVQNLCERAIEEGVGQNLQWVYFADEPLLGFRSKTKNKETDAQRMGAQFMMKKMPEGMTGDILSQTPQGLIYFDPDELHVEAKINPAAIQDKQAEANLAIIKQQAGISRTTSIEGLVEDAEMEMNQSIQEIMLMKMVEIDGLKQQLAAQAEAQMMQMQAQMQMQQQAMQQPGQPNPQGMVNEANAGAQTQVMQGRDTRQGAPSMAQVAPGQTQETVTGQTRGGQPIV